MTKFHGYIGFAETTETTPGVWTPVITEKEYYGTIYRDTRRWQGNGSVNDNLVVSNNISIIADPYSLENFFNIKYIKWMGVVWKVTNVEVQTPRLILTLGDIYNG